MKLLIINSISLIVLLISYLLFRRASGSMSIWKLNMISFIFYVFLVLMSFIGSVLVVNDIDNHYIIDKLRNNDVRIYGWAAVMYTMVVLPVGMLIAKHLFTLKSTKSILAKYQNKQISELITVKDSYVKVLLYVLCGISAVAVLYALYTVNNIPLLSLFRGQDVFELNQQRISTGRDFSGNEYIKNIFAVTLTPILTFIAYSYYKKTRDVKDRLWYYTMLLFTILILTYDLQKAPLVMFILSIVMLNIIIQRRIDRKKIIYYFFISILGLILGYSFLSESFELKTVFFSYNSGVFGRMILSSISGLFHSFDMFPERQPFLEFSSMSGLISDFFGMEYHERSARSIMRVVNPRGIETGVAGVVNSLFVAEAWANFGWIGVLVSPLYVGFLIGLFYYFFLLTKKTPIMLGMYGYFSCKSTLMGGINDYIYNAGYLVVFIVLTLIVAGSMHLYKLRN